MLALPCLRIPADAAVEPANNLVWVTGIGISGRNTRLTDGVPADGWNTRLTEAEALELGLDASDIALVTAWSNWQWDLSLDRIRDGGTWFRYTCQFEPGLYRWINRGYPNTNGNFDLTFTLRDTSTMEVVFTTGWFNNLKDVNVRTTRLTTDASAPAEPYEDLGPTKGATQNWWILNDVLELDGTYIVEVHQRRAGALGGQYSEFTFESLPLDKPTVNSIDLSSNVIDGCDGSITMTIDATPQNAGGEVEFQVLIGSYTLFDWTTVNTFELVFPGEYLVRAREVGFVVTVDNTFSLEKINCSPAPFAGTAQAIPGNVEFEHFDVGGFGIAYHEITSPLENKPGSFTVWTDRNAEENGKMGVDIAEPQADTVVVTDMGNNARKTSEWLIYTVDVQEAGDYNVSLLYYSNVNVGRDMQLEFWDNDMTEVFDTLNLRIPGNWDNWYQDSLPENGGIPTNVLDRYLEIVYDEQPLSLKTGTYKLKFYANAFSFLMDKLKFVKVADITPTLYVDPVSVQQTIPFRVAVNKNAEVYIVPTGTAADEAAIIAAALGSRGVLTNDTVNFATAEIDPGDYLMYAVDKIGNVSAAVEVTVEQLVVPVVQVAATQVYPASPFTVTMDIDGKVYLTPDGTTAEDNIPALAGDFVVEVTADTPADITTVGLDLGFYMIFGINNLGTVSEGIRVEVTTDINSVVDPGAGIIRVYPTIVNHTLNLELPSKGNVDFYNMIGVRVKSIQSFSSGQVNISDFRNGMYIVKVSTGETTKTFRIIKQ
jgi:hypothetical protein